MLCLSVPAFGSVLKMLKPHGVEGSSNCNIEGKWESAKNDLHAVINITYVFKNDSTYEANVLMDLDFPEPCGCRVYEAGTYEATPKERPDNLRMVVKTCQSTKCCSCEEEPVDYHIWFFKDCDLLIFDLPDHGIVDFKRAK